MYTLEGVSGVSNLITAYEEFQYNRDSHFLFVMKSLFPKAILLTFISSLMLTLILHCSPAFDDAKHFCNDAAIYVWS